MIKKIIRETIKEMVKNKELFTSVDVANKIKTSGTWMSNRDVSAQMKALFEKTYKRYMTTNINVTRSEDGAIVTAILYHPKTSDASTYKNTKAQAIKPNDTKTKQQSVTVTPDLTTATKDDDLNPQIADNKIGDSLKINKKRTTKSKGGRDYSKFNFN